MQQPMYLPNGYMMTYYPQMPPSNMPVYGMENGVQGRTLLVVSKTNISLAVLLQNPPNFHKCRNTMLLSPDVSESRFPV